jgi:hypothetical protein
MSKGEKNKIMKKWEHWLQGEHECFQECQRGRLMEN